MHSRYPPHVRASSRVDDMKVLEVVFAHCIFMHLRTLRVPVTSETTAYNECLDDVNTWDFCTSACAKTASTLREVSRSVFHRERSVHD